MRWLAACIATLSLAITGAAQPASTAPAPRIIAGVQVGPVRIGMPAGDAARAVVAFEQATGCTIDVLTGGGRVTAAGTGFGGCLQLSVPDGARSTVIMVGGRSMRVGAGIGAPASALVAAFGEPRRIPLASTSAALVWQQGLVAHVGGIQHGDGTVTYLAVVTPGSRAVPPIGHLIMDQNTLP